MNPLYATTQIGTLGELLVQTRLLEFDVQAAPPVKDSGNDLIAIRRTCFRALQVKTTTDGSIVRPNVDLLYHILAVVWLRTSNGRYSTCDSNVYLFDRDDLNHVGWHLEQTPEYILNQGAIERLFPQ